MNITIYPYLLIAKKKEALSIVYILLETKLNFKMLCLTIVQGNLLRNYYVTCHLMSGTNYCPFEAVLRQRIVFSFATQYLLFTNGTENGERVF